MKKITLAFFLLSTSFVGKGQNLVPNGDFEQYSICPWDLDLLDFAVPWFNPTLATPDYYNECSTGIWVGVPYHMMGYQPAHSGNGYAGVVQGEFGATWHEFIEVPLSTTLSSGTCYYFEMYINAADMAAYVSDAIGVYFSDTLISLNATSEFQFTPQINALGNFPDTMNWMLINGSYVAQGGENFLIIGNFKNDSNTTMLFTNPNGNFNGPYVYVDDVSLSVCTGIDEQNQNEAIKIYPNPAKDFINISFTLKEEKNVSVEVYDLYGRCVNRFSKSSRFGKSEPVKIDMRSFSCGIYIVEINTGEGIYRKKVLKE